MGSSSHSGKSGVKGKGVGLSTGDISVSASGGLEQGSNVLNLPGMEGVETLSDLLDIVRQAIKNNDIKKLDGTKLKINNTAVRKLSKDILDKRKPTGKLITKISGFKGSQGSGFGIGGAGGALSSMASQSLDELSDFAKELDLDRTDLEILKPAISEVRLLEQEIDFSEVKIKPDANDVSGIALLGAIILDQLNEEMGMVGIKPNQETVRGVMNNAVNEYAHLIPISSNDFTKAELKDFFEVAYE